MRPHRLLAIWLCALGPALLFADTHTGGSLSISKKGDVFVVPVTASCD